MLNKLPNNRTLLSRTTLVFGQLYSAHFVLPDKSKNEKIGYLLAFKITRHRSEANAYFLEENWATPHAHGDGKKIVIQPRDWVIIEFGRPGYEQYSTVIRIVYNKDDEPMLEFQDAAAWTAEHGQIEQAV